MFVDVIFILLYGVICLVTMAVVWGFLLSQQLAPIPRVVSTLEHVSCTFITHCNSKCGAIVCVCVCVRVL